MPLRQSIYTLLETAAKQPTKKARIEFLKQHQNETLHFILKFAYDPQVKFMLPPGPPPYNENNHPEQENNLPNQVKHLFYLIEGPGDHVNPQKKESILIRLLEFVTKEDAILLCHVKDKKLPFPEIDPIVVNEAFPGLLSGVVANLSNNFKYNMKKPEILVAPRPYASEQEVLEVPNLVFEGQATMEDLDRPDVSAAMKIEVIRAIEQTPEEIALEEVQTNLVKAKVKAKSKKKPAKKAAKKPTKKAAKKSAKKPAKKGVKKVN